METFVKILKVIIAGIVLGIAGFLVTKNIKKEVKKLEDADEKEAERLAEEGLDKRRMDKEMIPGVDDDNFTKALFMSIDSEWDEDFIDAQKCIDHQNVIHIGHTDTEFNVFLEIPKKIKGNYNSPSITDYLRVLKQEKYKLIEHLSRNSAFKYKIFSGLEGHIIVTFKNPEGNTSHGTMLITEKLYESYADENFDGFVRFVEDFRSMSPKEQLDVLYKSGSYNLDGITDLEVLDVKVLYRYTFNRQFITINVAKDILEYIVDNIKVSVKGNNNGSGVQYDYIMFNTLGPAGNWSLLHYYENYYTVDENTKDRVYNGLIKNKYVYKYNIEGESVDEKDTDDLFSKVRIKGYQKK